MKRYGVMVILVLVAGLIMFPFHSISESNNSEKPEKGVGQNEPAEKDDQSKIQVRGKTAFRFFTYKPPKRGMPGGRIGGGTRGKTDGYPILTVLAPDHTGLTTKTRPVLYWYLSTATPKQIEFTLILAREGKTVAQEIIHVEAGEGIRRLKLFDLGIELSPGKEYTWFISMVLVPGQPSKDIFSGGAIRLVRASEMLREKLAKAKKIEIPAIYAEEGVWYDALAALSKLIDENPETKTLHEQRAKLLDQVGLDQVDRSDRAR